MRIMDDGSRKVQALARRGAEHVFGSRKRKLHSRRLTSRIVALMLALLFAVPNFVLAEDLESVDVLETIMEDIAAADLVDTDTFEEVEVENIEPVAEELGEVVLGDAPPEDDVIEDASSNNEEDAFGEPFRGQADINGIHISIVAVAGAFPKGATMRVKASSDSEATWAFKAAFNADDCDHRLYSIEVLDEAGNIILPDYEKELPVVRVEGLDLSGDAKVLCYDWVEQSAFGIRSQIDDGSAIEFPFLDSTVYDVVTQLTGGDSEEPTVEPTEEPTAEPTEEPMEEPAAEATEEPTGEPTIESTEEPIAESTKEPTAEPTTEPTEEPTTEPTEEPINESTEEPAAEPIAESTEEPTAEPTTEPTEEPTETPISFPSQRFTGGRGGIRVSVDAPEGAFPEGTTMRVDPVWDDATLSDIETAVSGDYVEVKRVHAVNITFLNVEDMEIEPLLPISVVMSVDEIEQQQETIVVHVDDIGNTEVVDRAEEPAVAFEADAFSVYALVVTETVERVVKASDGNDYRITVSYGPEAGIPDGTTLEVVEIENPQPFIEQAADALRVSPGSISHGRLFDITLLTPDGEEAQPASGTHVDVSVTLNDIGTDVDVVHFGREAKEVTANTAGGAVSFAAEGFSVYGFFTVDFYYGEYEYHLPGEEQMLLSELFALLEIQSDVANVTSVTFSSPEYLAVEPVDGDWKLTSLAPFDTEETLTVRMRDGEIVVLVRDAAGYIKFVVIPTGWGEVYRDKDTKSTDYIRLNKSSGGVYVKYADNSAAYKESNNIASNTAVEYLFATWTYGGHLYASTSDNNSSYNAMAFGDANVPANSELQARFYPKTAKVILFDTEDSTSTQGTVSSNVYFFGSTEDGNAANVLPTATAATGYEFIGWYNGETLVSSNSTLMQDKLSGLDSRTVVTAHFNKLESSTIYYKTEGKGTVNRVNETVVPGTAAQGATATADKSSKFVYWKNENGEVCSDKENFVPTGDQIKDGAVYTAVFRNVCNLKVAERSGKFYKVESTGTNSEISNMYFSPSGLVNTVLAVPESGYYLEKFEVYRGAELIDTLTENPVHKDYMNGKSTSDEYTFKAYFKAIPEITITVDRPEGKAETDGTVTDGTTDFAYSARIVAPDNWIEPLSAYNNSQATTGQSKFMLTANVELDRTLTAVESGGVAFDGWYVNGEKISENKELDPKLITDPTITSIVAKFVDAPIITYKSDSRVSLIATYDSSKRPNTYPTEVEESVGQELIAGGAIALNALGNGNIFIAWIDSNNKVVSTDPEFIPTGDLVRTATYTAKFHPTRLIIQVDPVGWGKVYNSSNIDVTNTYDGIRSNAETVQLQNLHRAEAIDADKYVFDYWDLNGEKLSNTSATDFQDTGITKSSDNMRYILTAHFKPKDTVRVDYEAGEFGSVTNALDFYGADASYTGSKAVPDEHYVFEGWYDKEDLDGDPVYTEPEITPEVLKDILKPDVNTTYVAKFVESPNKRFKVSVEPDSCYGDVTYTSRGQNFTFVGNHTAGDDSNIKNTITARPATGALFDHWEWRSAEGELLSVVYETTLLSSTVVLQWDAQLVAVFKPNLDEAVTVIYKVVKEAYGNVQLSGGGEVSSSCSEIWINEADEAGGATAVRNEDGWLCAGWIVENADGTVRSVAGAPSTEEANCEFKPTNQQILDNMVENEDSSIATKYTVTFTAIFRPNHYGLVSYNTNLAGVDVTWNGVRDIIWGTKASGVAYGDANKDANGDFQYYGRKTGDNYTTFTVTREIPSAEGYSFIGWFDKSRADQIANIQKDDPDFTAFSQAENALRNAGDPLYFLYNASSTSGDQRYTLEALWLKIDADGMVVPYDAKSHKITATATVEAGTLMTDNRYKRSVIKILNEKDLIYNEADGTFTGVKPTYRVLGKDLNLSDAEDMKKLNPDLSGQEYDYSPEISETEPGVYWVRIKASAMGSPVYKDVTLTILPKTVTVVKYWDDDGQADQRPESLNVTLKAKKQGTEVVLPAYEASDWTTSGNAWTKTFTNLPFGDGDDLYIYSVEEAVPTGYHQVGEVIQDSVQAYASQLKDAKYQNDTFTITNAPNTLTVVKRVTGSMGERNRDFTFTLTVEGGGSFVWYKNGERQSEKLPSRGTFELRHGESVTIEFLPTDKDITLTEDNAYYTTTWRMGETALTPDTGTAGQSSVTVRLTGDDTLAVTNNLEAVSPTGVNARNGPYLLMLLLAIGLAVMTLAGRCRSDPRDDCPIGPSAAFADGDAAEVVAKRKADYGDVPLTGFEGPTVSSVCGADAHRTRRKRSRPRCRSGTPPDVDDG